ncbi:hypothetical protein NQZ68_014032 [Dissostichus eleginoides]|nr:hypothetical protein NQZ68_014032 [Dissostichus eleginoides]
MRNDKEQRKICTQERKWLTAQAVVQGSQFEQLLECLMEGDGSLSPPGAGGMHLKTNKSAFRAYLHSMHFKRQE